MSAYPAMAPAGNGSTHSAATAPAPAAAAPKVNDVQMVYHADILLLALFACFVLASLPRAFARIFAVDWRKGHFLRSIVPATGASIRRNQAALTRSNTNVLESEKIYAESDDSHTLTSHENLVKGRAQAGLDSAPPHVPAFSTFLHPVSSILRRRAAPGFSFGQALILCIYSAVLGYLTLYKSNLLSNPKRTGIVAMSQIPFVFAFGTKNNVLAGLVGLGYEKVNYLHRFVGRAIFVLIVIHTIGYSYKWVLAGTFAAEARQPSNVWGFVGMACLGVLAILSMPAIRQRFYRVFLGSHIAAYIIFLAAAVLHKPVTIPYVFAAIIIYSVDHAARLIKGRITTARIRPISELSITRVEIPGINAGWRAGQHVRLRVFSTKMGVVGWSEAHPFTVANDSGSEEGMVLMCKKAGYWTGKLYNMAVEGGYGEVGRGAGGDVRVMVEGPYGGPGLTVYASYSAALFVCGGSGITFALSAIQELVKADLQAPGSSRVKHIELVWSIQDPASLVPLIPTFTSLMQQTATPLTISVFYTRATPGVVRITKDYLLPGLSLTPGRPRIGKVLDSVISRTIVSERSEDMGPRGVIVGVCGPGGLGDEVARTVGQIDSSNRKAVGGVELHEEVFGW